MTITVTTKRTVWLRDVGWARAGRCGVPGCGAGVGLPEAVRRALRWPAAALAAPVAHLGHVWARSCGGGDGAANLRIICARCNLAMGVTHMSRFRVRPTLPECVDRMDIDEVGRRRGCLGVTRHGQLCKNRALAENRYCAVHAK